MIESTEEIGMINPYLMSTCDNTRIHFTGDKFIIGRSPQCSFVLDDYCISKTHCTFEKINQRWYLTDQSHNGISLNQRQMSPRTPYAVSDGDTIKLPNGSKYVFLNKTRDELNNVTNVLAGTSSGNRIQTSMSMHAYCKRNPLVPLDMDIRDMNPRKRSLRSSNLNVPDSTDSRNSNMPSTSGTNTKDELTTKKRKIQNNTEVVLENVDDSLQCIICTELFIKATTLGCSHTFCSYCIEAWKRRNGHCPVCRTEITSATPATNLDDKIADVIANSNVHVREERKEIVANRQLREDSLSSIGHSDEDSLSQASFYNTSSEEDNLSWFSSSSNNSSHSSQSSNDSAISSASDFRRMQDVLLYQNIESLNLTIGDDLSVLYFAAGLL